MELLDEIILNVAADFDGEFTVKDIRDAFRVEYKPYYNAQIRKTLTRSPWFQAYFNGRENIYINITNIKQEPAIINVGE